jgi:WD40 repeat protein
MRLLILGLSFFSIASAAYAQQVDRYGDPLPTGAIARLGTIRFRHEANSTTGVVFSPDGKLIATATNNSPYVFVFDVATGQRVAKFGPDDPNATLYWNGPTLAFEQGSKSLLIMKLGGQVERLDLASGKRIALKKPSFPAGVSQASADGRLVAVSDNTGKVHVLDYVDLKSIATIAGGGEIDMMSFDAAGKLLAIGDKKRKKFEVWELATGKVVWSADGTGYDFHIALSPSGKQVACTPDKAGFVTWTVGQDKPSFKQLSGSSSKAMTFSPDETTLVVQNSSTFEYWNLAGQKIERKQKIGFANGARYSPDGETIALIKSSKAIRLFNAKTGEERPVFETNYGEIKGIVASQDGSRVMTRGWSDAVIVWDVASQKPVYYNATGSSTPVAMAITPNGKRIISRWSGLECFDVESGKKLYKSRLSGRSDALSYSPDATLIAAASSGDKKYGVSILDAKSGEAKSFLSTESLVMSVAWHPKGQQIIASDSPTRIKVWDVADGKLAQSIEHEKAGVKSLAVHPTGKVLASVEGGFSAKLRFYRLDSGEPFELELEGYDAERRVNCQQVAFTGDGRYVVARIDFRLHVWDLRSRKLLAKLGTQADWYGPFTLSGDGKRLITASAMNHVLVWNMVKLIEHQTKP